MNKHPYYLTPADSVPFSFLKGEILYRSRKRNPKMYTEPQKIPNSKSDLLQNNDNNKPAGIIIPGFKVNYRATVVRSA